MRTGILYDRLGRLDKLDHKKIIIVALLARLVMASFYDVYVSVKGDDPIVPDSRLYSTRGWFVSLLLRGSDPQAIASDAILTNPKNRLIMEDIYKNDNGRLPRHMNEMNVFVYLIGAIYSLFGYFPLAVRFLNVLLSAGSAYLLFFVARRCFGGVAAKIFLITALALPTQVAYSLTLSRDFLRVFVFSLILWVIYGRKIS